MATDLYGLIWISQRKRNKVQYRPRLRDGRLAETGLIIGPW
ncbi:hypothetical protein ACFWAR_05460 [Streptomyces sp. NPDC059917]